MQFLNSTKTVVLVAVVAVVLPTVLRIFSSPIALLLFSPLLIALLALAFFLLNIYCAYVLDTRKARVDCRLRHTAKPFSFSTPAAWQAVITRSQWSNSLQQAYPPLYPESEEISEALEDIISKIIRDFLQTWYKDISTSPAFPAAVSSVIHSALEHLFDRAASIDMSALVVKRILPKITDHIEQFRQSEVSVRGAGLEKQFTQSEELDLMLASRYASKGSGKLHSAVENLSSTFTKQTEEMHLRQLVERALPAILPERESKSRAVNILVRELVACCVLFPVMEMITDPDFWNKVIDQVAGAAIRQQKLISKIRNVLEAQSPRTINRVPAAPPSAHTSMTERITIRTDVRHFESFLRSINRCSSLLDARRLKNDIAREIRRTRLLLANQEKDDWINGEKTEDVVAFLDRLYTAKRKMEERIVVLGGGEDNSRSNYQDAAKPTVSLRDILRNPNSLSYFMEFMDRRNRSLPVQFWLTVESFKNPLETVDSDSSGDEEEIVQDPTLSVNVKEDISMIHDLYFAGNTVPPALASVSRKYVDRIRAFVRGEDTSPTTQRRVRRSILLGQRQVEKEMEQDFEEFERSELWFRAVGDAGFTSSTKDSNPFDQSFSLPQDESNEHTLTPTPFHATYRQSHLQSRITSSKGQENIQRAESSGFAQSSRLFLSQQADHSHVKSNIEVLMSPIPDSTDSDSMRAPLFNDPEDDAQREEQTRMEAIHAALTDIMALEQKRRGLTPSPDHASELKPGLAPSTSPRQRAVFDDFPTMVDEEEVDDGEMEGASDTRSFQLATPGDLQLSYEIARLGENIANLEAQETMLDTLIKKAELTGDTQELNILKKSKAAMSRDLRELQFQRQQYEQQESANRLISDRTRVSIVSSTAAEEEGKSVVRYLVEVQQLATDGAFTSGWVVARRYNEFLSMHTKLRDKYALVKHLDFPGKRLVPNLSGSFLDTRKQSLEKYLQNVIAIPVVCESPDLRAFLSRDSPFMTSPSEQTASKGSSTFSGSDLVRNVYRSVAESIDDMFFGPSMLDVMIQRLTRQAAEFAGIVGSAVNDEELVAQAFNASGKAVPDAMQLPGDLKPLEGENSTSTFSAPICDLVLALFELNKKNNWLRRQAIVIILQQVLGGTIEKKVRDSIKDWFNESKVMKYIDIFRDSMWPDGRLKGPALARTSEEKIRTRDEANRKLSALVPDLAANVIGRSNARRGARRMFAVLQNRRLNQHIAYTIVDEVFAALFPEVAIVAKDQ